MPKTDAISLLTDDHQAVKKLFKAYRGLASAQGNETAKAEIAGRICRALTADAEAEPEIFYPALREAVEEVDRIDQAAAEQATIRELIARINAMKPGDDRYDAAVTVLGEHIDHHVRESRTRSFRERRRTWMQRSEN